MKDVKHTSGSSLRYWCSPAIMEGEERRGGEDEDLELWKGRAVTVRRRTGPK